MENKRDNSSNRVSIIDSVQTPLGFFTLTVLVVEVILGLTANFSQGLDRTYLVISMIVLIFLLVIIVSGFAYFRPEALRGGRPTTEHIPNNRQIQAALESQDTQISATQQGNDLGKGIKLGGAYKGTPLCVIASEWLKYDDGWVKSGWLYSPSYTWSHSVDFFKIHIGNDGSGVIYIVNCAEPPHSVWFETEITPRKEEMFVWESRSDVQKRATWQFRWK